MFAVVVLRPAHRARIVMQALVDQLPELRERFSQYQALIVRDMDLALLAYEHADMTQMDETRQLFQSVRDGMTIGVFIGPEGGFTPEEVELAMRSGVKPVTLGRRILRTETAGMTVLSWLVYLLEK